MASARAFVDGGYFQTARCKKLLLLPLLVLACWFRFGSVACAGPRSNCSLTIDRDTEIYSPPQPERGTNSSTSLRVFLYSSGTNLAHPVRLHTGGAGYLISEPGSPQPRDVSVLTKQTIAWLKANSPTADRVITTLENGRTEYKIMFYPDSDLLAQAKDLQVEFSGVADYFWSNRNQIHWDPRIGLKWTTIRQFKVQRLPGEVRLGYNMQNWPGDKGFISPAIILIHELGHAYDKEINPDRFTKEAETTIGGRWTTLEERRVLKEIEWPVVKELRENAGSTDALRPSHNGVGTFGYEPYEY